MMDGGFLEMNFDYIYHFAVISNVTDSGWNKRLLHHE